MDIDQHLALIKSEIETMRYEGHDSDFKLGIHLCAIESVVNDAVEEWAEKEDE